MRRNVERIDRAGDGADGELREETADDESEQRTEHTEQRALG